MAAAVAGSQATANATPAMDTAQVGDLVVVLAFRDGSATAPTVPAGWTTLATQSTSPSLVAASRVFDGLWSFAAFTNATATHALRITGYRASQPGVTAGATATNITITWAAVTLQDTSGASVLLRACVNTRPDVVIPTSTGHTLDQASGTRPGFITQHKTDTTASGAATSTVSRSSAWSVLQIEIRAGIVRVLGQAVETDSARPAAVPAGRVIETQLAQTATRAKQRTTGQASSTELALPATVVKSGGGTIVATGQATETDSAQPAAARKTRVAGQATETSLAQSAGRVKARLTAQATSTETAQSAARAKTQLAGQATETDTAQSAARVKTRATGQAVEADTTSPASHVKLKAAGQATETQVAQHATALKTRATGQAAETDAAQPAGRAKTRTTGQALEVDVALPATTQGTKVIATGQVVETSSAQPVTRVKRRAVSQAVEVSTVAAATASKMLMVATATETNTARAATAVKTLRTSGVFETNTAQPARARKTVWLGQAAETSTVFPASTGVVVLSGFYEGHGGVTSTSCLGRSKDGCDSDEAATAAGVTSGVGDVVGASGGVSIVGG